MNTELLKKLLQEIWEDSELYKLYHWINFVKTMIKIWYVDVFSKDEFHRWLGIPMDDMTSNQRQTCIMYLNKVRAQKHVLSSE
ncbi:MAG: hypothetical protein WCO66_04375 [Candidatus Absconditabacteria bacterium]|jgi:hypothetical protein